MKRLADYTPAELEDYFNSLLANNDHEGIEPRDVRDAMYQVIADKIGATNYSMYSTMTTGTHFSMKIGSIHVGFTVSIKGTGNYRAVSRTRNKEVKKFGKVKIGMVGRNLFSMPCFSYSEDRQSIVKDGSTSSSCETAVNYTKKDNVPFNQMLTKENIDARFDKKPLFDEIVLKMAQPYLQSCTSVLWHADEDDIIKRRKIKGSIPKDIYELLPKKFTSQEFWDSIHSIVRKYHKKEINKIIETIY